MAVKDHMTNEIHYILTTKTLMATELDKVGINNEELLSLKSQDHDR